MLPRKRFIQKFWDLGKTNSLFGIWNYFWKKKGGVGNNEVHLFSFAFVFTVAKDIIGFHPWEVKR